MTDDLELALDSGQACRALGFGRNVLEIESPKAFAPGSPVKLRATMQDQAFEIEGRALGSKRGEAQQFTVRMRLVSLRREHRQLLETALPATPSVLA